MARNDFYVIVYKMLTYLYVCMKSGEKPEADLISYERFNICEDYWANIVLELYEKGYITGIRKIPILGTNGGIILHDPKITMDGIAFLHENSLFEKVKKSLKELKEIVPQL